MKGAYKYTSVGLEMFDMWVGNLVWFLGCLIAIWMMNYSGVVVWSVSLLIFFLRLFFAMYQSRSTITRIRNWITLEDESKRVFLDKIEIVETWWNYDFGANESGVSVTGWEGQDKYSPVNKVNVYLKIGTEENYVLVREQIYMSGKFPHGHPYKLIYPHKDEVIFKVWDLDKCMERLNLNGLDINQSSLQKYLNSRKIEKPISLRNFK